MAKVKRVGDGHKIKLTRAELEMLASLVGQFQELMEADQSVVDDADPFARWQAELGDGEDLVRDDPVIARLFPDAYPSDPIASAEFRRLTQSGQRNERIEAASVVLAALSETDDGRLLVRPQDRESWLRTLNMVRISLSVRLDIKTSLDADDLVELGPEDPRSFVFAIYEWLGYLTESLLS